MTLFFSAPLARPDRLLPCAAKWRVGGTVFLAAVIGLTTVAAACSVPVFRYALEHWEPDPYRLTVFHRGPLPPAAEEHLAKLSQRLRDPDGRRLANLELITADLAGEVDDDARILGAPQGGDSLPLLVLQRPGVGGRSGEIVFRRPLQEGDLERLLDSPLRKTIASQLLEGESVVWVLLESGEAARDEAAFATLTAELQRLAETLRLPSIDPADAAELSVAPETLKISFAAHRLSRDDEQEEVFRELLLSVEPDLRDATYHGEPMAFPIFGRGRVLYALIGEGINRDTIEEACRFLTGGCQCTVKRENPGVDLLYAVDWSRFVEPTVPLKPPPPLVGLGGFGEEASESPAEGTSPGLDPDVDLVSSGVGNSTVAGPVPSGEASASASALSPALYAVLGVVSVVLVGTVVWFVLLRRG